MIPKSKNGTVTARNANNETSKKPTKTIIGPKSKATNKSIPPAKIHTGAVIIRINIINGARSIKRNKIAPAINTPKTNITSTIIANTAKETKMTINIVPKTVAVTNRTDNNIRSIVLGMKFQINQVGHVKIVIGKNAVRLRATSTGNGVK